MGLVNRKEERMTRNLRTLSLALLAVLALGALVASGASAQQGTLTADGPWTGIADETGGVGANRWTMAGFFVECPGSTYTVHKYNVTPHELAPSASTTFTLTPHYKQTNNNCISNFGWKATKHMNGCDYVIHLGQTIGGVNGTYNVTFDIACPPGKEITTTLFTTAEQHAADTVACIHHTKSQTGLVGAHATNTGGDIGIHGTVKGVHITQTSTGHTILCPHQTTVNGEIDIDITVTGKNGAGGATALEISHP